MAHVVADSSSSSMADQLSVNLGQEYRVKLGRSFTFPEQNSFHTIKYDFKPQSVDSTQPGQLKVTDDEVNVSLPVQSQGESVEEFTLFRGNKKPCTKECILIIDTRTGEAVLEKISNNVNLKAVRDGRKPAVVNRDRSVSPSPLMMQPKGHPASKSQLSTGGSTHRHLTPSPIPSATPTPSNNSTLSATKGGGASGGGGSNATPGNSSKKGQKRQTKSKTPKTPAIVPTSATKQESRGRNGSKPKTKKKSDSSTKQASIPTAPKINKTEPAVVAAPQISQAAAAMSSMPVIGMGMEPMREISPIHSNNPTPEPIRPPSRKKQKPLSPLTRSSSSSSSDSSNSDSEGEEPMSQAPPTQQAPVQFSSVPVTRVTSAQSQISSIGNSNSMPIFSHSQPFTQKGHIAQKSHPGQVGQAKIPPPPNQRLSSGSSSGSDSDSSSGSSSSDSSSDSSDEDDKEVAAISRGPMAPGQRAYQRSFSELKSDLQLSSDSGSSSD